MYAHTVLKENHFIKEDNMNKNTENISQNIRSLIAFLLNKGGYHEMAEEAMKCEPFVLEALSNTAFFVAKYNIQEKGK